MSKHVKKKKKEKSLGTQKVIMSEIYKYYHFVGITWIFALKCKRDRQEFQNSEVRHSGDPLFNNLTSKNYKKQLHKGSGNCPKGIKQMEKYSFKKIY